MSSELTYIQILEGLLKLPENRECADCKAKYVSKIFKRDEMDIMILKDLVFTIEIGSVKDLNVVL